MSQYPHQQSTDGIGLTYGVDGNMPAYPPNMMFEGHPHAPLNPPVGFPIGPVVSLETVEQALNPLYSAAHETTASIQTIAKNLDDLGNRLRAIESALKSTRRKDAGDGRDGDDGDDETEGDPNTGRPRKRARASKKATEPKSDELHLMQDVVRRILYQGCDVSKMEEFQAGLNDEELRQRIRDDPEAPWRPDFAVAADDARNKFWIDKITAACLDDPEAKEKVDSGKIPKEYWNREKILDCVLKSMWYSARKGFRRGTNPEAQAQAAQAAQQANRNDRRSRLCSGRLRVAVGSDKFPPFLYSVNNKTVTIPSELIIEDATSDVFSDSEEHNVAGIRPDTTKRKYLDARRPFKYEGIPPFWRHNVWNNVNSGLDDGLKSRPHAPQPRFYAGEGNRGQRIVDEDEVANIPTMTIFRCHIAKDWYDRLPDDKKHTIRPSPSGWEVDEELEQLAATR